MKNYEKEIQELEDKIKILKEEKKSYDLMRPNYKLAELIHSKTCTWNHTDGCDWYYESWEGFKNNSTKMRYLDKANKILEKVSYADAMYVISNI